MDPKHRIQTKINALQAARDHLLKQQPSETVAITQLEVMADNLMKRPVLFRGELCGFFLRGRRRVCRRPFNYWTTPSTQALEHPGHTRYCTPRATSLAYRVTTPPTINC